MKVNPDPIYIGNNNNIYVRDLKNPVDKALDAGADFSFTLKDSSGTNVAGAISIEMPHYDDGYYFGVLAGSVSLTAGELYTAVITDADMTLRWEVDLLAQVRKE